MAARPWSVRCRDRLLPALENVRMALERHIDSAATGSRGAAATEDGGGERAFARLRGEGSAALDVLATAFDLDAFETAVLVLCAGVELDGRIAGLCARAHGDARKRYATFGLALAALPGAHFRATTPQAALRRWALVALGAGEGVAERALHVEERVLHFLGGVSYLDAALEGLVAPCGDETELAPSQRRDAERAAALLREEAAHGRRPLLHLAEATRDVRVALAAAACRDIGLSLHALRAADIPHDARARAELSRLWAREAVLGKSGLLVESDDETAPAARAALAAFLDGAGGIVLLSGGPAPELRARAVVRIEAALPTAPEQRALWREVLPALRAADLDRLAGQFALAPRAIAELGAAARARVDGAANEDALVAAAWDAARSRARPELGALARCIEPRASWELLVLPEAQRQTLREVTAHVRQRQNVYETWGFGGRSARGMGISALFSGPSGTGKTMAAEVIARELSLDLVHVDLSSVVSKYIGETEKNLRRIFDAAEQGGAILLFDEADALFGRRSEVKDSHDRYANIEVSYLLQRMEAYRGLAILTTNLADNLDPAFMRRIRFVVRFPYPAPEERAEIWRRIFPAETPTDNLDAERLGRLEIPGGNIRNIALHAAFIAAEERSAVTMRHLAEAARNELRKIGRAPPERELRGWT